MRLQLSCPPWKKLRVACISEFPQRQVATERGRTCCNAIHDFTPVWNKPVTPFSSLNISNEFFHLQLSFSLGPKHTLIFLLAGRALKRKMYFGLVFLPGSCISIAKGRVNVCIHYFLTFFSSFVYTPYIFFWVKKYTFSFSNSHLKYICQRYI